MFEKLVERRKNSRQPRTCSHPIYAFFDGLLNQIQITGAPHDIKINSLNRLSHDELFSGTPSSALFDLTFWYTFFHILPLLIGAKLLPVAVIRILALLLLVPRLVT